MATKFCIVAPNIYGSSVWNLLHITRLERRHLSWLLHILKIVHPCVKVFVKVLFYPMLPDFQNSPAFWKVPRLRPFVFLVRVTCIWRCVSSTGRKILTGENRSIWRKTCTRATFFAANITRTDLGSNPGLGRDRPVTNRLNHGTTN
jgi:hypothetical protein